MVEEFICNECNRVFKKKQALLVHGYYHVQGYKEWRKELSMNSVVRLRRSLAAKARQSKPEVREKFRKTVSTDEYKRKNSEKQKQAQNRPEVKAKRKRTHASVEYKEKQRAAQLIAQNKPETLLKQSIARVKALIEGRAKINSRGKQGTYQSLKAGAVHYRSTYELKAFKILDDRDDVVSFEVEAFSVPYMFNEKMKRCVPDILVKTLVETIIVEVKPQYRLKEEQTITKLEAIKNFCGERKMKFEIWTEKELNI